MRSDPPSLLKSSVSGFEGVHVTSAEAMENMTASPETRPVISKRAVLAVEIQAISSPPVPFHRGSVINGLKNSQARKNDNGFLWR